MNLQRSILLAGAIALLNACGSSRAVYKYQLKQVAKGDNLSDASQSIQQPLVYDSTDFKITWTPGPLTYFFRIDNKSKANLQINFEKSFLISPGGNTFASVHPGNSAIAKGDNFIIVPAQAGVDSWIRPGQKQGQNDGGLAGSIAPGFDGGGFFPESGDADELRKEYTGKKVTVVLNIGKGTKNENFRFTLQVADVIEQ